MLLSGWEEETVVKTKWPGTCAMAVSRVYGAGRPEGWGGGTILGQDPLVTERLVKGGGWGRIGNKGGGWDVEVCLTVRKVHLLLQEKMWGVE